MAITITDVANEAGVSKSTVSKVLNNWSTISPATVARVNAAIEKLHYVPNSRAVSFARQSTRNIVYLTNLAKDSAYQNPHMFDIMCGVHHELAANHYALTLVDVSEESYPGERVYQEINRHSSDGLIIHGSAITSEIASLIITESFPHIIIGHPGFESRLCWVDTNHSLAGEYAASHLYDYGYSDVAFIAGKKSDDISSQRLKGFLNGMLHRGIHIPKSRIGYTTATKEGAYDTTLHLLSEIHPQAIVCENSLLSLGVMKALQTLHLSVPQDMGLLTFDTYPYTGIIDPKLTVIDINVYDMGVQAGNMMIRKLEHPELLIQSYTTLPMLLQGDSTIKQN